MNRLAPLFVCSIFMLLFSSFSYGVTTRGKVNYVGSYGNGDVFVDINTSILERGCNSTRFDIPKTRANINYIISTANLAIQQNKNVEVTTQGCYAGFPTLDNSRNSWFYIIQ